MKKRISVFLIFLLLLSGCAKSTNPAGPLVVTTNFPAYDFARQILGDEGQVVLLIPLGGEAHGYEPTLKDLAMVQSCDVFIYNGGESDAYAEQLLEKCDRNKKTVIRMMDHVELLIAGEEHHEHHHQHTHHEADEHIWVTPQNALRIANAIGKGLQTAVPNHAEQYEKNSAVLQKGLQMLVEQYEILRKATHKPLLVADRFPFTYLVQEYDLLYYAAFSGCTSNTEVGVSAMSELLEQARTHEVQTVLYTEFSNGNLASHIAKGVGSKTAVWHSCHNVSKQDFENEITYQQLMMNNLDVLKEALF